MNGSHEIAADLNASGFLCPDLELVRFGTHDVYQSQRAGLVVRVHNRESNSDQLTRWNATINRLAQQGARIVQPVQEEPVGLRDGRWATLWPLGNSDKQSFKQMALALRTLRGFQDNALPKWDPFPKIDNRLSIATNLGIPTSILDQLTKETNDLRASMPEMNSAVTLHGDAHIGNLVDIKGRGLLIDLDDLCRGAQEVDVAPTIVSQRRFGLPVSSVEDFLTALNPGELNETVLTWVCSIRELTMLTWLSTLWNRRVEARTELEWRLATWHKEGAWNPL